MLIADCTLNTAVRLSRPWLVVERLSLAFTQPIATAMGLLRAACASPYGPAAPPLSKIAPGNFVTPGLSSADRPFAVATILPQCESYPA